MPKQTKFAHTQVMVKPTPSTSTKVGVTPPAKPASGNKGGGGKLPGATNNSKGIKGY